MGGDTSFTLHPLLPMNQFRGCLHIPLFIYFVQVINGHVDTVISRGRVVVENNEYHGAKGHGQYLKRGLSQYLL